jgi:ketosteroid isomerase-like protein
MHFRRDSGQNIVRSRCTMDSERSVQQPSSRPPPARIVRSVNTATEVADHVYARWNEGGLSVLTDRVHPEIELICDPLSPDESALRGIEGWNHWVARWETSYQSMHVTIDGLVPIDDEHVLALVSIEATPTGAKRSLRWAAAHVWTVREGRIARWETHLDLGVARRTLD